MIEELVSQLREIASSLDAVIADFLQLPAGEAVADLDQTFETLGKHPWLGIGALSGLLGLFGYVKAAGELADQDVSAASLISASDTSDFAIRLAVPFLLLVGILVGLQASWLLLLRRDHRRVSSYTLWFTLGLILMSVPFAVLWWWAPPVTAYVPDGARLFFGVAVLAVAIPFAALVWAGQQVGVESDDRFQRRLRSSLRRLASPLGLFLALVALGFVILGTRGISALLPKRHVWEQAADDRVLENSASGTSILIDGQVTRLGEMTLVQAYVDGSDPRKTELLMLATKNVGCVRKQNAGKDESALAVTCVTPQKPEAPIAGSIASFAVADLGCSAASFRTKGRVLGARFALNEPRTEWVDGDPMDRWSVPVGNLMLGGLTGLSEASLDRNDIDPSELLRRLSEEPGSRVWVLGFASASYTVGWNWDLSERRAAALKKDLARHLAPGLADRIKTRAIGETSLADLFGVDASEEDQLAVAFWCK